VTAQSDAHHAQAAHGALLVRPVRFGYNSQTALSNRFQHADAQCADAAAQAGIEFEALCTQLRAAGVRLCVAQDTAEPEKPDAVFPNNWVSFHRDGTVVLYPMQAPNRRPERRLDIIAAVEAQLGFRRRRLLDMSPYELSGRFLEGTGSLVLDHVQRIAYACRSARTDDALVGEWSRLMSYQPLLFDARDSDGAPPYHTNVLLCIGSRWAAVCAEAISAPDRSRVLRRLHDSGRQIIEISPLAMRGFAGNMLELTAMDALGAARAVLVLSATARSVLQCSDARAWERLSGSVEQTVAVAVPVIERLGGGSVRCMLAEVPEQAA
jgi:hypothetical protein